LLFEAVTEVLTLIVSDSRVRTVGVSRQVFSDSLCGSGYLQGSTVFFPLQSVARMGGWHF